MSLAPTASLPDVDRFVPAEEIVRQVRAEGGVVFRQFLDAEQVASINREIEPAMHAIHAGSISDVQLVRDFHGDQTKRLTNIMSMSPTFRSAVLDDDLYHELGEAMFREESGDWWLTSAQVIEIGPGNSAQPLHRDLGNFPPYVRMGPDGPEAIANLLIALNEFTDDNGATRVIPGSNRDADFRDRGDPARTVPAIMQPGDAIYFSGKLLHGGGANVTADRRRRALTVATQPCFLTPEEAYPFLVDIELVRTLPTRVQKLIGFRSVYPKNTPGLWQHNYEELALHLGL